MNALRIGLCGNGTVGGGTMELLQGESALLRARAGRALQLCRLGARRARTDCPSGGVAVHKDLMEVALAQDIDVLVECIGGTTLALELVRAALRSGKSVVTANKALIAVHGNELLALAEANKVSLLCEAAVAGGIPILKALREGLAANRVSSVAGIINGTGNFILTAMESGGQCFADALADAQSLGYAEADPTFDVEGIDAAHKLTILASMAFAMPLSFERVYCEGISAVSPEDIHLAGELGYRIKHLGVARQSDAGVELRVHPTLLPKHSLLANVNGVLNAVRLQAHAVGETFYSGAGAGRLPTASAIVADLVDLARANGNPIDCLGVPLAGLVPQSIVAMDHVENDWYLRFAPKAGAAEHSKILDGLRAAGLSVEKSLSGSAGSSAQAAQLAVLVHAVREPVLREALAAISTLTAASGPSSCIRVELAG